MVVGLYLPADPRGKDITLNNLNLDFIPINENVVFAGDINLLQTPSTQSLSSKDNTSYPGWAKWQGLMDARQSIDAFNINNIEIRRSKI